MAFRASHAKRLVANDRATIDLSWFVAGRTGERAVVVVERKARVALVIKGHQLEALCTRVAAGAIGLRSSAINCSAHCKRDAELTKVHILVARRAGFGSG